MLPSTRGHSNFCIGPLTCLMSLGLGCEVVSSLSASFSLRFGGAMLVGWRGWPKLESCMHANDLEACAWRL